MQGIWGITVWLGGFTLLFILVIVLLKFVNVLQKWMNMRDNETNMVSVLRMMKFVPFFIIVLPLVNFMFSLWNNAEGIDDFYISTSSFQYLVVEMAPTVVAFIFGWSIIYVISIIAYDRYGGSE